MAAEENVQQLFKGPVFALVIGVSEYLFGSKGKDVPRIKRINDLEFAAKDAADFAELMKSEIGVPSTVYPLIANDATARNIREKFAQLKRECDAADPKPLIFIFFSGHG